MMTYLEDVDDFGHDAEDSVTLRIVSKMKMILRQSIWKKINLINSMTTGQKDMRPTSFRFVDEQLYYMQQKGMSEEQAYDTVYAVTSKPWS